MVRVLRGRTIAQEVSRRLPSAAARFRAQVRSCGICGGRSGTGGKFSPNTSVPLPIFILSTAPHSLLHLAKLWADVPNGPSLTPPQEIK
jgi:hypothetical protein